MAAPTGYAALLESSPVSASPHQVIAKPIPWDKYIAKINFPTDSGKPRSLPSSPAPRDQAHVIRRKSKAFDNRYADEMVPEKTSLQEERQLLHNLQDLRHQEEVTLHNIQEQEGLFAKRMQPLVEEMDEIRLRAGRLVDELELLREGRLHQDEDAPTGPKNLMWVENELFGAACMLVIIVNLVVMVLEMLHSKEDRRPHFWYCDQVFMVFYVVELTLKAVLHQRGFLIGTVCLSRGFRWLDLVIVCSGVVDQWVCPVLKAAGVMGSGDGKPGGSGGHFHPVAFRALRILRITRIFRIFKALKLVANMDLSWADGPKFETFTLSVILCNAATMGMELDLKWPQFYYLNLMFLAVYSFEMLVKIKRHKWNFFCEVSQATWNWLDFLIVIAGYFDLLGVPAYRFTVSLVTGQPVVPSNSGFLSMIRVFRLVRLFRLYRLLKMNKSLRKLVMGIAEAMQGTFWVIVLCFVILYIFAIVFTVLVGQGLVFNPDQIPEEALETFGTVEGSLYALFKLMNDDQSVVGFTESVWVKGLFMISMVVLNWVMLATLTSVVTDHMNTATQRAETEDGKVEELLQRDLAQKKIAKIFEELDKDKDGGIDREEFVAMLMDKTKRTDMCSTCNLEPEDLVELFEYLSYQVGDKRIIKYDQFIRMLTFEGKVASERTVFRLEERLRAFESRSQQRMENLMRLVAFPMITREGKHQDLVVASPQPEIPRWQEVAQDITRTILEEKYQEAMTAANLSFDVSDEEDELPQP
eukprot:CAMPEP_0203888180 /NCGR_PEP_ID=MMETSP0359-20131031/31801_1 /ASSEMBLY_ACC=CAM_ASM_000338 /TAXON_ID=268821 /ORGANISM="Scrippsiella Hangoei, Strain SHTV-5" /LENGTH=752 /DNA_ID=CAMNT_0050809319 /DNA_START=11 /DNA_END=2269 /DNA_ORIENTATION=+